MNNPSPQVNPEFVSYLTAAGFQCHFSSARSAEYHLNNVKVTLTNETAAFSRYSHGETLGWISFAVVNFRFVKIDLYQWAQLLDSLSIVSLKKAISQVDRKERLALLAEICRTLNVDPSVLS